MQDTLYGKSGPHGSPQRSRPLTFPAILSDPLVRLMMRADRVDARELERSLAGIAAAVAQTQPHLPARSRCAERC